MAGGSPHRVCPGCKEQNRDWEERVRSTVAELGLTGEAFQRGYGGTYR